MEIQEWRTEGIFSILKRPIIVGLVFFYSSSTWEQALITWISNSFSLESLINTTTKNLFRNLFNPHNGESAEFLRHKHDMNVLDYMENTYTLVVDSV